MYIKIKKADRLTSMGNAEVEQGKHSALKNKLMTTCGYNWNHKSYLPLTGRIGAEGSKRRKFSFKTPIPDSNAEILTLYFCHWQHK